MYVCLFIMCVQCTNKQTNKTYKKRSPFPSSWIEVLSLVVLPSPMKKCGTFFFICFTSYKAGLASDTLASRLVSVWKQSPSRSSNSLTCPSSPLLRSHTQPLSHDLFMSSEAPKWGLFGEKKRLALRFVIFHFSIEIHTPFRSPRRPPVPKTPLPP
jgi:hypothetical protein